MNHATFFVSTDNLVEVLGVYDEAGKAYVGDATVTARLMSADASSTLSTVTCTVYEAARGNYRGQFDDSVSVVKGTKYLLEVVIQKATTKTTIRQEVHAAYYKGRSN